LALIVEAARACGPLLKSSFGAPVKNWAKAGGSPVSEIDLALDEQIKRILRGARPDYGWLSEETPDDAVRLAHARIFIVDPLDGTDAFLRGVAEFCVSIGVAENGRMIAGCVYNPISEEVFAAARGEGATRNGAPIAASRKAALAGARVIAAKTFFASPRWRTPWPAMAVTQKAALAYRLALVAAGEVDGAVSLGFKNEWDIAAGVLLVEEAGGVARDGSGRPLAFNQPDPRSPGLVAAGPNLFPLLSERLRTEGA
jgi:myo-inositol-1(or 4)-monophosphatase